MAKTVLQCTLLHDCVKIEVPILFRGSAPVRGGKHKVIFRLRNTETNWEKLKGEIIMPVIKFSVNDADYKIIEANAHAQKMRISEFVRLAVLNTPSIFTSVEAERRALAQFAPNTDFTLPMVYGKDWEGVGTYAGGFGNNFYYYVTNYSTKIEFVCMKRHAIYRIKSPKNSKENPND